MNKLLAVAVTMACLTPTASLAQNRCKGSGDVAGIVCRRVLATGVDAGIPFPPAAIDQFCSDVGYRALSRCVDGAMDRYIVHAGTPKVCGDIGLYVRDVFHNVCMGRLPNAKTAEGRKLWSGFCQAARPDVERETIQFCQRSLEE